MSVPKFKLILGVLVVWGASVFPKQFFVDLLHETVIDSSAFGIDFVSPLVQLGIILIGSLGISMIKSVLCRSSSNKRRF